MNDNVPYVGIVRFNIFIHKMNPDGSVDPEIVDCSEYFKNFKISSKADLQVSEIGLLKCIESIKEKMEKLQ